MTTLQKILVNTLLFNAGWFACVLSSRWGVPLAAWGFVGGILAVHLLVVTPRLDRAAEVRAILAVGALGAAVDTLNHVYGIFGFEHGGAGLFAVWILAFWINFAATINTGLRWFHGRPIIQVIVGVVGAPGTYFFGSVLGALTLGDDPRRSMIILAVQWAVLLPAYFWIAGRLRGITGADPGLRRGASGAGASGSTERPAA